MYWVKANGSQAVALCLFISLLIFGEILCGISSPLASSYAQYEPWSQFVTAEESKLAANLVSDPTTQTWPWLQYAHDCMQDGDFPLWNFRIFSGTPFIGNRLTGLLNPLVLIPVYFLNSLAALTVIYFTHYLLAGIFFYLFLREMKLSHTAGLIGSACFLLQGTYIPCGGIPSTDHAYFPMCLYFLERLLARKDRTGYLGFVISLYLLSVTGYPQCVVYSIYIFIAWVLFTRWDSAANNLKRLFGLGLIFLLVFMLGAAQHLPTAEFYQQSLRSNPEFQSDLNSRSRFEEYDSPASLAVLYFPKLFGDCTDGLTTGLPTQVVAALNHGYAGILPAIGVLFLPLVWSNRRARFFGIVFLLGCAFIACDGLLILASKILPGLRISRVKPHFMAITAMVIASCFVLDYVIENIRTNATLKKRTGKLHFFLLASVIGIGSLVLTAFLFPGIFLYHDQMRIMHIFCGLTVATIGLSLVVLYSSGRLGSGLLTAGILAVTLCNLVPYNCHFNTNVPRYRPIFSTPGIQLLQDRYHSDGPYRIFRDGSRIMPSNSLMLFGLDEAGGYDSMVMNRYGSYFRRIDPAMAENERTLKMPYGYEAYSETFWDYLGIKYIVATEPMPRLPDKWPLVYDDEMFIYRNEGWQPRFFIVGNVIAADTFEHSCELVRSIDTSSHAVITPGYGNMASIGRLLARDSDIGPEWNIEINEYHADMVTVTVETDADSLLVFSDSYYPGWRAFVDGEETEILRTNCLCKGIMIAEGSHEVKFSYRPMSWFIGLAVTGTGIVMIFPLLLYLKKWRIINNG